MPARVKPVWQVDRYSRVNQLDVIHRGLIALGLLPALAFAGESGRLTIGGYVPPKQRVAAVQTQALVDGPTVVVVQEQNNSALGYSVTIESRTAEGRSQANPGLQLKCDGQSVSFRGNEAKLSRAPSRSGWSSAAKTLEVTAAAPRKDTVLILTVASQ